MSRFPKPPHIHSRHGKNFENFSVADVIVTIKIYKLYSARVKRGLGFEPTTLRDLVGCSKTELLGTLWCARVQY